MDLLQQINHLVPAALSLLRSPPAAVALFPRPVLINRQSQLSQLYSVPAYLRQLPDPDHDNVNDDDFHRHAYGPLLLRCSMDISPSSIHNISFSGLMAPLIPCNFDLLPNSTIRSCRKLSNYDEDVDGLYLTSADSTITTVLFRPAADRFIDVEFQELCDQSSCRIQDDECDLWRSSRSDEVVQQYNDSCICSSPIDTIAQQSLITTEQMNSPDKTIDYNLILLNSINDQCCDSSRIIDCCCRLLPERSTMRATVPEYLTLRIIDLMLNIDDKRSGRDDDLSEDTTGTTSCGLWTETSNKMVEEAKMSTLGCEERRLIKESKLCDNRIGRRRGVSRGKASSATSNMKRVSAGSSRDLFKCTMFQLWEQQLMEADPFRIQKSRKWKGGISSRRCRSRMKEAAAANAKERRRRQSESYRWRSSAHDDWWPWKVKAVAYVSREAAGELSAAANQVAVGLAGAGLALILFVGSRMLGVNATLDTTNLSYLLRGMGLIWLSSALNNLASSTSLTKRRRRQMRGANHLQSLTFRACVVVILTLLRFA